MKVEYGELRIEYIYRRVKMVVYNAIVVLTLTYRAESWVLKEREK